MDIKLYKSRNGTVVHFDNSGQYAENFSEIVITCSNQMFQYIESNGFTCLCIEKQFPSLKDAIQYGVLRLNLLTPDYKFVIDT
jgi:hypothetical protein